MIAVLIWLLIAIIAIAIISCFFYGIGAIIGIIYAARQDWKERHGK